MCSISFTYNYGWMSCPESGGNSNYRLSPGKKGQQADCISFPYCIGSQKWMARVAVLISVTNVSFSSLGGCPGSYSTFIVVHRYTVHSSHYSVLAGILCLALHFRLCEFYWSSRSAAVCCFILGLVQRCVSWFFCGEVLTRGTRYLLSQTSTQVYMTMLVLSS